MKDGTLQIIKSILATDDSLSQEDKLAILAFCKKPKTVSSRYEPETYLTPKDITKLLKVTLRTVQCWISEGKLKSLKIIGCRRIPSSSFQEFIQTYSSAGGRDVTTAIKQEQDVERVAV